MANLDKWRFVWLEHFWFWFVMHGKCVCEHAFPENASLLPALHAYNYVMEQSVEKTTKQIKPETMHGWHKMSSAAHAGFHSQALLDRSHRSRNLFKQEQLNSTRCSLRTQTYFRLSFLSTENNVCGTEPLNDFCDVATSVSRWPIRLNDRMKLETARL